MSISALHFLSSMFRLRRRLVGDTQQGGSRNEEAVDLQALSLL